MYVVECDEVEERHLEGRSQNLYLMAVPSRNGRSNFAKLFSGWRICLCLLKTGTMSPSFVMVVLNRLTAGGARGGCSGSPFPS
jgi:hypothetical protein